MHSARACVQTISGLHYRLFLCCGRRVEELSLHHTTSFDCGSTGALQGPLGNDCVLRSLTSQCKSVKGEANPEFVVTKPVGDFVHRAYKGCFECLLMPLFLQCQAIPFAGCDDQPIDPSRNPSETWTTERPIDLRFDTTEPPG